MTVKTINTITCDSENTQYNRVKHDYASLIIFRPKLMNNWYFLFFHD